MAAIADYLRDNDSFVSRPKLKKPIKKPQRPEYHTSQDTRKSSIFATLMLFSCRADTSFMSSNVLKRAKLGISTSKVGLYQTQTQHSSIHTSILPNLPRRPSTEAQNGRLSSQALTSLATRYEHAPHDTVGFIDTKVALMIACC